MKNTLRLIGFLFLASNISVLAQSKQTEEYAIITVVDYGSILMYTTIGEDSTTVKEWIYERKKKSPKDYSLITKELTRLNKRGFKLFASNDSSGHSSEGTDSPRTTYTMIKSID